MRITLKSILIFLGAVFALVGFGMMFMDPLEVLAPDILNGGALKVVGTIDWKQALLGIKEGSDSTATHTFISFVGFVLMGAGGILGLGLANLGTKPKVYLASLLIGLVTVTLIACGAALAVLTETSYLAELGIAKDSALDLVNLTTGPIIACSAGGLGGLLILIGSLLPCRRGK